MSAQLIAYQVERETKSPLLTNFRDIIGIPSYCPRCLLRGQHVRWWPVRQEEWQVCRCSVCDYWVMDR